MCLHVFIFVIVDMHMLARNRSAETVTVSHMLTYLSVYRICVFICTYSIKDLKYRGGGCGVFGGVLSTFSFQEFVGNMISVGFVKKNLRICKIVENY